MTPDQEYVLKTVKSRDVHFVRFWFTDCLGRMKSFAVSPNELESAFEEGIGFDGSSVDGFAGAAESDMLAFPEASTFQVLPWRPDANAVARMFCTIKTPTGELCEGDPRHILARTVERLARSGYDAIVGPEVEYFYFKDSSGAEVLDHGGYFDLTSLDSASDLRRDTVLALEKMGIPVEYSHHEIGPSQHEVDLRFSDAMSMADAVMTYKMIVKEIAATHGVYASFMPKPLDDAPGSGMHVHMSLFDKEGTNAFFDANDPAGLNLSDTAKHFIAGLLAYAPEFSLLTNQYVNSYKRLGVQPDAPSVVSWGRGNRCCLVRVPGYKPHKESACRIELRSPDPACNPYLAFAAMLSAGLQGIEDALPLEDALQACPPAGCSREEVAEAGLKMLPESLGEAIKLFEESAFARSVLGAQTHAYLVAEKKREWREYLTQVNEWDISHYLEVL